MTTLAFGLIAGLLSAIAFVPYVIDTIKGDTQPQRACWLIWSVLGAISFFSQVYEGADASLLFAGVQVGATIIIFVLSIWFGKGTFVNTLDILVLGAAAFGLILWHYTDTAVYALAISIAISLMGGSLTVAKAYRNPDSETLSTWVISLSASVFGLLAVGEMSPVLLAYPMYLFTLYVAFIISILAGRARRSNALPQPLENVVAGVPIRHETD